jgi:putative PIG3 family NAD(P)H quinone oxidoreductase
MRPRPDVSLTPTARSEHPDPSREGAADYGTLWGVKAIVAQKPGPPEVLELMEVETPSPRPNEVLIKVAAAGVNRADLLQRQGHYQPPPGAGTTLGLEVSGTVAEVGEDVSNWEVDDPCVALLSGGGYAEYVVAPAGQVVPPPLGVELAAAAAVIEVAATVYSNIELIGLSDGDCFLVHGGAGGIGSFAIQYAKSIGATVITTAGREDKLDYCRSIGADHAISYRDDWPSAVRAVATDGVQMILDIIGAKYLADHVNLLADDGALVIIGMQGGRTGTLDLGSLSARRGLVTANLLRARPVEQKAAICRGLVENIWPLIADNTIKQPPVTVFPFADAAAAHAHLESGENIGKIILSVGR